ncbi:MAG TPA: NHLP bacteriocin export ABC transporter permease/ATPase subunit [Cyanobacteria bacterium UBA8803]|nr:NHLP bacteriocin export ABC transporter permease/ATPase subunit [Cyanobacteria bacterium UBA9273]HBL57561.1 NHLP bacteriocin export ABC transporter permease/ATPase subunit [Cyanobacteria bacterium UBA8803]
MKNKYTVLNSTKFVRQGEVLLLDEPQQVWMIESGSVAVFLSQNQNGSLQGSRRYLFTAEVGEALFGFATSQNFNSLSILVVPITDSTLLHFHRSELDSNISSSNIFITTWFKQLSSVFNLSGILLPAPEVFSYTPWQTQLTILDNFHQEFLSCLQELEQQSQLETLAQFQERERLNQAATVGAIADFVSLIAPKQATTAFVSDPLLAAAGAVGHAMGIQIKPPSKSENMQRVKEPLEAIARASQMRIRRVLLSERWWRVDCGPILAYLQADNTPVALLLNGKMNYEIYNPVTLKRIPVSDRTAKLLSPNGYMFYPPFPEKKVDLLTLFQYSLRGRGRELLSLLVLGIAAALTGMVVPQATGVLIDTAIPDADRGLLLQLTLGLLAASFGVAIFRVTQGINLNRIEMYSYFNTQSAVWDRLLRLRLAFFRQYSSGEMLSRVNAINQIRGKLGADKLDILFKSLFSLLNLGLLFIYSPSLASVAVVIVLLTVIVTSIAGHFKRQKTAQMEELEGEIGGLTIQLVGGISKLRTTGSEGRAFAFWAKYYQQQLKLMRDNQSIEDLIATFNILQSNLTPIVIFWMTASLLSQAQTGSLSTGTFLAFNTAFAVFITGVTTLSNNLIDLLEIGVLWEHAKPIVDELPEVDLNKADPGRLSGYVKLDHVTFRYREDGPLNLDDVTIEAKPGEFIAFVGPSGSGKSTTLRMLLGFDVPEQGTVYYDGQDLSGLDVSAVRRQLGVVLQNGRINSESVFENISGGALIRMEECWEAARMAGFAEDIENMPMGMHTVISEGGANLSGGQRQRLLIARALVLKPRIIFFDEATSALDNRTQAIVSESLEKLKVTRIAIAHRLSTIRNADRIYVIEAGRVVQQGTFEELASQDGLFAKLMAKQVKVRQKSLVNTGV